jgi:nitroreductase
MDFFALLKKRHSVRKFKPKAIDSRTEKKLFNAINSAPSAGNMQSYAVFAVREREKKRLIAEACFNQGFIGSAPLILVFFADSSKAEQKYAQRGSLYALQDAAIAASYAQLAASALGLGSCWVGAFDDLKIQKLFNNAQGLKAVAVIPIGFPAEKPLPTSRRAIQETVREDALE